MPPLQFQSLHFDCEAVFILEGLKTSTGEKGKFFLYCLLCVWIGLMLTICFDLRACVIKTIFGKPPQQEQTLQQDNKVHMTCMVRFLMVSWYFFHVLWWFVVFLLVVTFNGWVILSLAFGMSIGYSYKTVVKHYKDQIKDD